MRRYQIPTVPFEQSRYRITRYQGGDCPSYYYATWRDAKAAFVEYLDWDATYFPCTVTLSRTGRLKRRQSQVCSIQRNPAPKIWTVYVEGQFAGGMVMQ